MVSHIPHFIRRFGSPKNFDTSSFEMAHKFFVKQLFTLTNKGESAPEQMMKKLSIQETCATILNITNSATLKEDLIENEPTSSESPVDEEELVEMSDLAKKQTPRIVFTNNDSPSLPDDLDYETVRYL